MVNPTPTNNVWRLAGAMGLDEDPTNAAVQEAMLQGIGFPLRPVEGVPPTGAPEIPEGVLAQGVPMQWMGNWREGIYYPRGAFVEDGNFAAVANKLTLEKPAPVGDPDDPATYSLPSYAPTTQANTSVVTSGQQTVFGQDGWIKELRVWVPVVSVTTNYRFITINVTDPEAPLTTTVENAFLVGGQWTTIGLFNTIIKAGEAWVFAIEALNTGASTQILGSWFYSGPSQGGAPNSQSWTQDNKRANFRIDKTDADSVDRATELESVIPESTIQVVDAANIGNNVTYRVTDVIDQGAYMEYVVVLQGQAGIIPNGATTTVDIQVPTPLATEYDEELNVWGTLPSWAASGNGFLEFNGVDQGVPLTNAYGVDILFEPALVSEDWDIVSFTTPS